MKIYWEKYDKWVQGKIFSKEDDFYTVRIDFNVDRKEGIKKMYTAVAKDQHIRVIDMKTGATKRLIKFNGTLIQGPVVGADEFSVTVRHNANLMYVLIYSLPHGSLRRRIRV